jgi:hypothetical protein
MALQFLAPTPSAAFSRSLPPPRTRWHVHGVVGWVGGGQPIGQCPQRRLVVSAAHVGEADRPDTGMEYPGHHPLQRAIGRPRQPCKATHHPGRLCQRRRR